MTNPNERPDNWLPPTPAPGQQPPSFPGDPAPPPQDWPPQDWPPQDWHQQAPPQQEWPAQAPPRQGPPTQDWPSQPPAPTAQPAFPPPPAGPSGRPMVACYRHPGVAAGVGCQRCGRPLCGQCMIEAPVGHQCPECVARGLAETRQASLPYGGRRSADPARTSLVLIAINALVWLGGFLTGGTRSPLFTALSLSPRSLCVAGNSYYPGFDAAACSAAGATYLPGVTGGAWWQLLTNAFVHVDLMHIGFNMLALWFLGPSLERVLGRTRFLALYFLSALCGSVFVLFLSDPLSQTAGASGAIFGLLGALLVVVVRSRGDARNLLMWLGLNVMITIFGASWISWQGHLGGFVGGVIVALVLVALRGRGRERLQLGALGAFGVVLIVAAVIRALLLT